MSQETAGPFKTIVTSLASVMLVPPVVFVLTGLGKSMSLVEVFNAMLAQYTGRPNLLITGAIGLLPLGAMGLVLWVHRRQKGAARTRKYLFRASMFALILVLIWANQEFWRVFLPQRISPGFPHGLELFIGPVFFAPVAMFVAMLAAWAIQRFGR
ncbi:MAG TPA: hypothetical protein VJ984_13145 [Xanthomonadales bacterium]|nr:hypothetical protein [Xanthomonadales bacterium]